MGGPAWKDFLCDHENMDEIQYSWFLLLCRCIENERADDATYDITASIVELYNEQVCHMSSGRTNGSHRPRGAMRLMGSMHRLLGNASWQKAAYYLPRKGLTRLKGTQLCLAELTVRRALTGGLAQVWDLLAPGGKQELELAKSIGGFDIPDLTQIGKGLCTAPCAIAVIMRCLPSSQAAMPYQSYVTVHQQMPIKTCLNHPDMAAGVTSPEQILGIMAHGFEHRATGCHDINAHSSRSHCLLIIHAAATDPTTGVRSVGKLTLCDLAGSERINKTGATGECTVDWPKL